ncbi:hypothetical protein KKF61_09305 [Patescibacteria group bacterium]|nr:hypothetical protein [Patescibacteria group bacterium]
MEFNAEQILIYVLVGYLLVQSILIRKDAKESVQALGNILHEAQKDSKEREEGIWKRANVELEVKHRQLQEAHKVVLRAKSPLLVQQQQPDLPFSGPMSQNGQRARSTRRSGIPDSATMG